MNTEAIENAIEVLAFRIENGADSADAQRYSQSCLNLAHVLSVLLQNEIAALDEFAARKGAHPMRVIPETRL